MRVIFLDYPREQVCGIPISSLRNLDMRTSIARKLKRLTRLSSENLKKQLDGIIRQMDAFRVLRRLIVPWWLRYQRKHKGVTWFLPSLSENDRELFSMEEIKDIPSPFFMSLQQRGTFYTFDMRSLPYLRSTGFRNPYTQTEIDEEGIRNLEKREAVMLARGYLLERPDAIHVPRNEEEALRLRVMDLFQKMDGLGMYTNVEWFHHLTVSQLRSWYKSAEDIWNYRTELPLARKQEINPKMDSFLISVSEVSRLKDKPRLQKVVLDEIERLISNGNDNSERILGGFYVMTAFAEILPEVAICFPWLVG